MNTINNERKYLTFVLTDESGKEHEYTLPLLNYLPARYIKEIAAVSSLPEDEASGALVNLQFDILEQFAPGLIDIATTADVKEIMELWNQATESEGISLGE